MARLLTLAVQDLNIALMAVKRLMADAQPMRYDSARRLINLKQTRAQTDTGKGIMNKEDRIKSFEEFWPYYVREHSAEGCRLLHFIGSGLGLICLISTFITGNLWFIPLGLALGYGFAWSGHFFIERNKPATFQYPLWSFRGDWRMWRLMLLGRMREELERIERAV